jgi:hypothetical protein
MPRWRPAAQAVQEGRKRLFIMVRDPDRRPQRLQQELGVWTPLPFRTVTVNVVQPVSPAWLRPPVAVAVTV